MRYTLLICSIFFCAISLAQKNSALISGKIVDENENPISNVSIIILGKQKGISSSDSGTFTIKVPTEKSFSLIFSHVGFEEIQRNFFMSHSEIENITIKLFSSQKVLESVLISDKKERTETGLLKLNAKDALLVPSTTGGLEGMIKTIVGSNNELTSQYNVRGGNYDENLIYINDFEIFRPYLVSNGQQEGLSFINPEMVRNVNFYSGGFQAKYGDKMSSVLDIQYKKPSHFNGSAYVSFLEQGLQLNGEIKKGKSTYLIGLRNKNNQSLLASQPTVGSYIPSSRDLQCLISNKLSNKITFELLGIFSITKFSYIPESVKKTSSVFSPLFSSNLGLDVYFDGKEKDSYNTSLIGATIIHQVNNHLKLKWLLSSFKNEENENYDITGSYLFGERDFDNTSSTFGEITNPLGAGIYEQYARNRLKIELWNLGHRGSFEKENHYFQWGNNVEQLKINDIVREFQFQDSAGYALPYSNDGNSNIKGIYSKNELSIIKWNGFIQDNIHFFTPKNDYSLQLGVRYNYNNLNQELIISPRAQLSWKPQWKKDFVFKLATGIYNQPPFYRELKNYAGSLNPCIKSQKSIQYVAGLDYQFKDKVATPFRISIEGYFKSMNDIIPYDIDNVKIRYLGENNAKAYATGVEFRLFGELSKDAESWLSLGLMKTMENLKNDYYYNYLNAAGEIISASSQDQIVTDSIKNDIGFLRRPTDRLITVGLFLQDYLATNKNIKAFLSILYGSNMPYNIPNSTKYRNGLIIDPYIRVDAGFSALLLSDKNKRRSHNPFRNFDNIWLNLEIFNLINRANTISYQLIKDFSNTTFAIPNKLTPRLLNIKMIARF